MALSHTIYVPVAEEEITNKIGPLWPMVTIRVSYTLIMKLMKPEPASIVSLHL